LRRTRWPLWHAARADCRPRQYVLGAWKMTFFILFTSSVSACTKLK
jgi:hypothetical protein